MSYRKNNETKQQNVLFRCVHASLYEGLSVRESIRPLVRPLVGNAFFLMVREQVMFHILTAIVILSFLWRFQMNSAI